MRRKRSVRLGEKSLSIALFFIILVALLVGLGIALKVYLLFKAAKFDGEHQFIVELHTPSIQQVIALSPDTSSAVIVSTSKQQPTSFGNSLEIPEDGLILLSEKYDSLYSLAQNLLFHPPSQLPLNIIDRIRFFLFVNNMKPTNITEVGWSGSQDDKKLAQLFTDHTAYTENLAIAVVNGSGISGLGNKVAQELTHIGLNVISVTSAQNLTDKTSIVYSGKESYTTNRLMHIFGVQARESSSPMVSDITITLGKDESGGL